MSKFLIADSEGYFEGFGGAYVPEMLFPNLLELTDCYHQIIQEEAFQKEYLALLKNYVGRPTALYHATNLSKQYNTNIYLKREDLNHTGAHKINNAIGQALIAKRLGKKRIIAETGAGQHGVATATACALLGLECIVYMGSVDTKRQQPNVKRMEMLGAKVRAVESGTKVLKDATNEAIRDWIANPVDTHYILGSAVGPHPYPEMVAYFQSVISAEMREQFVAQTGTQDPSHVIACVGGGSNAIGTFYHYIDRTVVKLIGVEAAGEGLNSGKTAATLSLGTVGVLHGSKTILLQTADGQIEEAHSISAGLDYPGTGPQHAALKIAGRVQYVSVTDSQALVAAKLLSRTEGIIPALESAHAIAYLEQANFKPLDQIIINLSGRGDKDLDTYIKFLL